MDKQALNAVKARAMAKEVGLFPEGNWKWALRNMRDGRGNALEGKELADAKTKIGTMANNSYQTLKRAEQQNAHGYRVGEPSAGTELGGVLDNEGNVIHGYRGEKGEASVAHPGDLFYGNKRMFHTHPAGSQIVDIHQARKNMKHMKNELEYFTQVFDNNPYDLTVYEDGTSAAGFGEKQKEAKDILMDIYHGQNVADENARRFTLGRNPLHVDMSGRDARAWLRQSGGTKLGLQHLRDRHKQLVDRGTGVFREMEDYLNNGGRDTDVIVGIRKKYNADLRRAFRSSENQYQLDHAHELGADYGSETRRTQHRKGDVLHNILAPELDMEGVHKMHQDGRVRSVYFDRTPRKIREQEAEALRKKAGIERTDSSNSVVEPVAEPTMGPLFESEASHHSVWPYVATGSGVGAAGLGAYGIHRHLKHKEQEKAAKEMGYGLVKLANTHQEKKAYTEEDVNRWYAEDPELDHLRVRDMEAQEQADADRSAMNDARSQVIGKGMKIGVGVGLGLGLIPGILKRNLDIGFAGTALGGVGGVLTGGGIANQHFNKTSPLVPQAQQSMQAAYDASNAHINRWMQHAYPGEYEE